MNRCPSPPGESFVKEEEVEWVFCCFFFFFSPEDASKFGRSASKLPLISLRSLHRIAPSCSAAF